MCIRDRFNIVLLLVLAALFWAIYVRVRGFWARRVDPVIDRIDSAAEETSGRVKGWFRRK